MPFITQGKTNLKYILIVVILAIIVGGGILGYYYLWIKELETKLAELELKLSEVKTPETTLPEPISFADITNHSEFRFWLSQWQKLAPTLSEAEFYLESEGSISGYNPYKPNEEELRLPITNRYAFSPDKTRFLDYFA